MTQYLEFKFWLFKVFSSNCWKKEQGHSIFFMQKNKKSNVCYLINKNLNLIYIK